MTYDAQVGRIAPPPESSTGSLSSSTTALFRQGDTSPFTKPNTADQHLQDFHIVDAEKEAHGTKAHDAATPADHTMPVEAGVDPAAGMNSYNKEEFKHEVKRFFGLEKGTPPGELNPLGPEDVGDMIPDKQNHGIDTIGKDFMHDVKRFFGVDEGPLPIAYGEQNPSDVATGRTSDPMRQGSGGNDGPLPIHYGEQNPSDVATGRTSEPMRQGSGDLAVGDPTAGFQSYNSDEFAHEVKRFFGLEKGTAPGELNPLGPEDVGDMIPDERNHGIDTIVQDFMHDVKQLFGTNDTAAAPPDFAPSDLSDA